MFSTTTIISLCKSKLLFPLSQKLSSFHPLSEKYEKISKRKQSQSFISGWLDDFSQLSICSKNSWEWREQANNSSELEESKKQSEIVLN